MSRQEDELLARELGKIAAKGGQIGATFSGLPDSELAEKLVGLSASLGAKAAARFLPTERYQRQVRVPGDARAVLAGVYAFLASNGHVATAEEVGGESPYPAISGVLGSGFLNLNPAVLHAEIVQIDAEGCTVLVSGAAKEGLIKQHTAEKAVNRLVEALLALKTG